MKIVDRNGKQLKIMEEINDERYGTVISGFLDHERVYLIDDEVVTEQAVAFSVWYA